MQHTLTADKCHISVFGNMDQVPLTAYSYAARECAASAKPSQGGCGKFMVNYSLSKVRSSLIALRLPTRSLIWRSSRRFWMTCARNTEPPNRAHKPSPMRNAA
ncbi:uncharacterized protein LOC116805742 [Drosophila grimshawi]|uniref:uncharacterized protein LOC116805742 n=1 Tax=Drosophila grimshawi TaxID=7222 RepID=UPI0013EF4797|nr:uncharacterized protein LOC116805742 [Drosophila grimshawi]